MRVRYTAMQGVFEFAFTRLLNAWCLLLEGYHFDARCLQRVAWESTNRGAYFFSHDGAAQDYLNGTDLSEKSVRNFLTEAYKANFPQEWAKTGDVLTNQWNTMSTYNHSYTIGVIQLQAKIDGQTVSIGQIGIRKRDELYVSFYWGVFLMQRIAAVLGQALKDFPDWPGELTEHIRQSELDRKALEARIQNDFFQ